MPNSNKLFNKLLTSKSNNDNMIQKALLKN